MSEEYDTVLNFVAKIHQTVSDSKELEEAIAALEPSIEAMDPNNISGAKDFYEKLHRTLLTQRIMIQHFSEHQLMIDEHLTNLVQKYTQQ